METEYSVVPSPAKPTPDEILEAYKEKSINLEALFPSDGADGGQGEEPAF